LTPRTGSGRGVPLRADKRRAGQGPEEFERDLERVRAERAFLDGVIDDALREATEDGPERVQAVAEHYSREAVFGSIGNFNLVIGVPRPPQNPDR
jgi:hypothetical protein